MNKLVLTDGSGRWIDTDRRGGNSWVESFVWNGDGRRVSKVTGLESATEDLYLTQGGTYVLHRQPSKLCSSETAEMITEAEAKAWIAKDGRPETEAERTDPAAALEIV
jgi:hypothetical protein